MPSWCQLVLRQSEGVVGRDPDLRERDKPLELSNTQETHHRASLLSNDVPVGIREKTHGSEARHEEICLTVNYIINE